MFSFKEKLQNLKTSGIDVKAQIQKVLSDKVIFSEERREDPNTTKSRPSATHKRNAI